ncbi:hypothetical protein AMELA_G00280470 [Ameiurus melas]|uniref:Uncharacterized protein n=1 Tax=Ameiurus melas TaxID=219545 RepID=A0A7J5ZKQ3_AMEME|nr:hypothetical protein AMELA_G00280470 [Ameiurus melas]
MRFFFCSSVDSDDSDGNEINTLNKEEKKEKKLSWWKKKKSSKTEEEEGPRVKVNGEGVREGVKENLDVVHQIIELPPAAMSVEGRASGTVSWNMKPQKLLGHQGADAWPIE